MGNNQGVQEQNKEQQPKQSLKKFVLQLRDRDIVLSFEKKVKVKIGDMNIFPSGFERLRLWDSSIVLARYILKNINLFEGKEVLQLFSGTGLASITLKLYTKTKSIAATDRLPEVTENIKMNCLKNSINSGMTIAAIKWSEYKNFKTKYDYVVGNDVFFQDCPVQLLANVFRKLLKVNGRGIIIAPDKTKQKDRREEFMKLLRQYGFIIKIEKLTDRDYFDSPLLNKVQGLEEFELIQEGNFSLIFFEKVKEILVNENQVKVQKGAQKEFKLQNVNKSLQKQQVKAQKEQKEQEKAQQIKEIEEEKEKAQIRQESEKSKEQQEIQQKIHQKDEKQNLPQNAVQESDDKVKSKEEVKSGEVKSEEEVKSEKKSIEGENADEKLEQKVDDNEMNQQ